MGLSVWMEVTIGGYSKEAFMGQMNVQGDGFGTHARNMIQHELFTTLPKKRILTITRCKPSDLGCTKSSNYCQLKRAVNRVGSLCPFELGPRLREKLTRKAEGDEVLIVMDQIPNSNGDPSIFRVVQFPDAKVVDEVIQGQKIVHGKSMFSDSKIDPTIDVVFVLRAREADV